MKKLLLAITATLALSAPMTANAWYEPLTQKQIESRFKFAALIEYCHINHVKGAHWKDKEIFYGVYYTGDFLSTYFQDFFDQGVSIKGWNSGKYDPKNIKSWGDCKREISKGFY